MAPAARSSRHQPTEPDSWANSVAPLLLWSLCRLRCSQERLCLSSVFLAGNSAPFGQCLGSRVAERPTNLDGRLDRARHHGHVMVFWQTVLLDEREDRSTLRWPWAWLPNHDYLHRTGPIRQRSLRGREFLSSDVAFVDLARLISLRTDNPPPPTGGSPGPIVKRLYPLDPHSRTLAMSIAMNLPGFNSFFEIDTVKPNRLPPAVIWRPSEHSLFEVDTIDLVRWCSDLSMRVRGMAEAVPLTRLGSLVARHLEEVTGGESTGSVIPVGHAVYIQTNYRNVAMRAVHAPDAHAPDLIVDQPPELVGTPFVGLANRTRPSNRERRLRTYTLRTFAEVQIGTTLLPKLGDGTQPWARQCCEDSLAFLSRDAPYAQNGEMGRRVWQMSVRRTNSTFGAVKTLTRERLEGALARSSDTYSTGNVVVMGDVYNVGQAGAVGRKSRGEIVNLGGSMVDLRQLQAELELVRTHTDDDDDVRVLTKAILAARAEDAPAVGHWLKKLSQRSLAIARDLGVAVAAAAITSATGLT